MLFIKQNQYTGARKIITRLWVRDREALIEWEKWEKNVRCLFSNYYR